MSLKKGQMIEFANKNKRAAVFLHVVDKNGIDFKLATTADEKDFEKQMQKLIRTMKLGAFKWAVAPPRITERSSLVSASAKGEKSRERAAKAVNTVFFIGRSS